MPAVKGTFPALVGIQALLRATVPWVALKFDVDDTIFWVSEPIISIACMDPDSCSF